MKSKRRAGRKTSSASSATPPAMNQSRPAQPRGGVVNVPLDRSSDRSALPPLAAAAAAEVVGRASAVTASRPQFVGQVLLHLVEGDALLAHRVALAHGDRLVLQRVAVDRDAEWRADLVHPRVPLAD